LDGYLARLDGSVDFLFMPKDYSMAEFFKTIGTIVFGRKNVGGRGEVRWRIGLRHADLRFLADGGAGGARRGDLHERDSGGVGGAHEGEAGQGHFPHGRRRTGAELFGAAGFPERRFELTECKT
jgi:hypothetical protein